MKRIFLSVLLISILPLHVFAQQEKETVVEEKALEEEVQKEKTFTYGVEDDFNALYVWRGIQWNKGVMQPSAWFGAYGFELSVWANFVFDDQFNHGQFNEIDLILNYEYELAGLKIEPRIEYWFYPNQDDAPSTGEAAMKLAYPVIDSLYVYTDNAFDYKEYKKSYFGEFGFYYEKDVTDNISVKAGTNIGWGNSKFNDIYLGLSKTAMNVFCISVELAYYPVSFFYIRPHFEFSAIIDDDLAEQVDDRALENIGLAVGLEF